MRDVLIHVVEPRPDDDRPFREDLEQVTLSNVRLEDVWREGNDVRGTITGALVVELQRPLEVVEGSTEVQASEVEKKVEEHDFAIGEGKESERQGYGAGKQGEGSDRQGYGTGKQDEVLHGQSERPRRQDAWGVSRGEGAAAQGERVRSDRGALNVELENPVAWSKPRDWFGGIGSLWARGTREELLFGCGTVVAALLLLGYAINAVYLINHWLSPVQSEIVWRAIAAGTLVLLSVWLFRTILGEGEFRRILAGTEGRVLRGMWLWMILSVVSGFAIVVMLPSLVLLVLYALCLADRPRS